MANATDSFQSRALAPHSELAKHYYYRPIEEFTMNAGTAAPWFGSNGGATQFIKYHPDGTLYTVNDLLDEKLLEEIESECESKYFSLGESKKYNLCGRGKWLIKCILFM